MVLLTNNTILAMIVIFKTVEYCILDLSLMVCIVTHIFFFKLYLMDPKIFFVNFQELRIWKLLQNTLLQKVCHKHEYN